jgi:four helix bundle protein
VETEVTKKQPIIKTFEDLDVWKVCRNLRTQIATITHAFPKDEQYRLRDQLIRASRSVTANIAEGYGRFHYTENIQFARLARGSLYEIIDHLTVAQEEKLISDETFTLLRENAVRAKSVDHV